MRAFAAERGVRSHYQKSMRKPNESEKVADQWLRSRGFSDIVFEPDGNVPPDFSIRGSIAVEVRRLNEHMFDDRGAVALEQADFPLRGHVETLLSSFGSVECGSWWVEYKFARPVRSWRKLEPELRLWLEAVRDDQSSQVRTAGFGSNFSIRAKRRSHKHDLLFELGAYDDSDSGGWRWQSLSQNLDHCIAEKTTRVKDFVHRYPIWWLVLVDHIDYAGAANEREKIAAWSQSGCPWARVVVVSPLDPNLHYDLLRASEI